MEDSKEEGRSLQPEISVVIPCLNEEESLGFCLERARSVMREHGIVGEIIVADNGSTDRSVAIAQEYGARVVHVKEKGYGSALMGGIENARAPYVVMGDADGSYDFGETPNFLTKLREGYDLVQGCRLPKGGGTVLPGAMPFLHRWLGNPLLTLWARIMFRIPINDIYCGLRGFSAELYKRLDQRCTGMEFAVEMIIKSSLMKARIGEIPVTLSPDQRVTSEPHLRTFRDGWRTVRYFFLSSPKWLYLIPGGLLCLVGAVGYGLIAVGASIGTAQLGVHSLLCASLCLICGHQAIVFGVFAKTYAIVEGLLPAGPSFHRFFNVFNLERGLLLSALLFLFGMGLVAYVAYTWYLVDFGRLDYATSMRLVIPGVTLMIVAFQTVLSSFFVSMMGLSRR